MKKPFVTIANHTKNQKWHVTQSTGAFFC